MRGRGFHVPPAQAIRPSTKRPYHARIGPKPARNQLVSVDIFVRLQTNGESARSVAKRYGIEENNVYQIKFRTGRILRKYGPKCFEKALRKEGHR